MLKIMMIMKRCRYTLTAYLITFVSYFRDLYLRVHMFIRIIIHERTLMIMEIHRFPIIY
jgi:hypothetical protein